METVGWHREEGFVVSRETSGGGVLVPLDGELGMVMVGSGERSNYRPVR